MKKLLWLFLGALLCAVSAHAQVSVALAPVGKLQFLSATGVPLANGKVFTYTCGTTSLLNTYKDSFGVIQNTDPIILDQGGFADIWLASLCYKFVVQNSVGAQQWSTDNIQTYFGLLNTANTWTFQQTFSLPIIDTATDNQLVLGTPGNQTILDFPPPVGNVTIHFPNTTGTVVTTGGNNTYTGTNTFTGPTLVKTLNNTQMCDQFPPGTADVQINACIAALPSTGGIADARGLIGAQTVANEIDVGSSSKFVNLLLPCGAVWNVTISNGTSSAIKVFGGSSVTSNCAQNNAMQLKLAGAGNVGSLVTNDQTCGSCSLKISGMMLYNTLGGTVANAMMDLSNLGNNAEVSSVDIATFKTKGLWIHGANSESVFTSVNVDGGQTAGAIPCTIETTAQSLETMRFFGLDCQHPGAGNSVLNINGHGGGFLCCLSFFGSHFEGSNTDTTTPFVSITDARTLAFYSPLFNSLDAGTTNWGLNIAQTGAGLTDNITMISATHGNASFVNDTIRSKQISGGAPGTLSFYQFGGRELMAEGVAIPEIAAPPLCGGFGAFACIYSDSTLHLPKMATNGGNYHPLRPIEVGVCTMIGGTCTVTWGTSFTSAPTCIAQWNATGTLTGFVQAAASTTNCVVTSSVNTNTAVMQVIGIGSPN